jgi:drug/metabolite transporter (DMT)-like permease
LSLPDLHTPNLWKLYAIALLATLLWSINYIFARHALIEFPPMLVTGMRTGIAALVMLPIYFWHMRGSNRPDWTRRDLVTVVSLGILGVGLNQALFVLGFSRTSVAHAAFIVGLTPMFVVLIAAVLGHERLRALQLAGMAVALTGVAVLQFSSGNERQSSTLGDVLIFCGCFTFAIFTVRGKLETRRLGPIILNTWAYVASTIALLPVTIWYSARFSFENVSSRAWIGVFYMAVFSSVLGYLMYYYALTHIPASRVSTFSYLQPLLAMVLAMIFLGERLSPSLFSGGALVLAGVFLAERA